MTEAETVTETVVLDAVPVDPERDLKAEILIRNHVLAACAGSILPLPGIDMAAVSGVQLNMIRKLAALFSKKFSEAPVRNTVAALVGGVGGQSVGIVAGVSVAKLVPVVGWAAGVVVMPTIVGASTYAIGRVFLRHFQEGGSIADISAEKMKGYYAEQREAGKKVVASVKDKIHKRTAPPQSDATEAASA